MESMVRVGIVMGSDSDLRVMQEAACGIGGTANHL